MKRRQRYHKGRWAVECERQGFPAYSKPPLDPNLTPIADVIPGLMKEMGLESRFWENALIEEWATLVGPQVVRHTRPGRYERKVLTIFVTSSPWLHELSRFGKHEILKKLQQRFGKDKILNIKLQLDPDRR